MHRAPFSADEIREAAYEGKQMLYHVQAVDEEPYLRMTTYLEVDDDGVVFEFANYDSSGQPLEDAIEAGASWEELEGHATYPAEMTEVSDVVLEVVAGTFDCWLYEVRTEDEEGGTGMLRAYFAHERPGPPIRLEEFEGDELVFLMELVEASE